MSIKSRLNRINNKMPEPEVVIVVHLEGTPLPDDWDWGKAIIVGASPQWLSRQKKLEDEK